MTAVEDRLAKSGFSESALGWATILSEEMETKSHMEGLQLSMEQKNVTMVPSSEAIVGLTQKNVLLSSGRRGGPKNRDNDDW